MRTACTTVATAVLIAAVTGSGAATADDSGLRVAETAVRIAGGTSPSTRIQYYALHGDVGFQLWRHADQWFTDRDVAARWIVEPWVAFVNDQHRPHKTSGVEIGVSPIFGKLTFGGARLRPFVEGGEGIFYTDRHKRQLGSTVLFSSQIGGGFEYQIRPGLAFTLAARLRHASNAGLAHNNSGVNVLFGLVGLTFR